MIRITPDLSCFGKAMANGYAIAAVCGKEEIMKKAERKYEEAINCYKAAQKKGHNVELARRWEQRIPLHARALLLSPGKLYIAGPPNVLSLESVVKKFSTPETQEILKKQDALLVGNTDAILQVVSCEDGSKLSELQLDSVPVFDGMAAAYGKLYIIMKDGTVQCLGE